MIKLIDLYCGAGGAAMGYYRAAQKLGLQIEITGVDINPQPNYPFRFIQADAVDFFTENHHLFTHVHASPPCQKYSVSTVQFRKQGKEYADLVEPTRKVLDVSKLPYVIENVPNAPMRKDVVLRGDLFGLKVIRKRVFEIKGFDCKSPQLRKLTGTAKDGDYISVYGDCGLKKGCKRLKGFENTTVINSWKHAMGINWMKKSKELAEAIPPDYSEFIGMSFFKDIIPGSAQLQSEITVFPGSAQLQSEITVPGLDCWQRQSVKRKGDRIVTKILSLPEEEKQYILERIKSNCF